jgi:maltooligosyltrehalose trehalohydrolase
VLLTAPMTPMLFMGQEWSASTPFRFFTDLEPELGRLVTEGRRREFAGFPEFAAADARTKIPDPQSPSTCEASRLQWGEIEEPEHAAVLALYRSLITLRLKHPAFGASSQTTCEAEAIDGDGLVIRRADPTGVYWVVVRLKRPGSIELSHLAGGGPGHADKWKVLLTTEELPYAVDPVPPTIDASGITPIVRFHRAGAVILQQPAAG